MHKCVRQRSLPCEASECVVVLPGDLVLCFQVLVLICILIFLCPLQSKIMLLNTVYLHQHLKPCLQEDNVTIFSLINCASLLDYHLSNFIEFDLSEIGN